MSNILIPNGWMQKDIEKTPSDYREPDETSSVTNIDDRGLLLHYNPEIRDLRKENEQHMISRKSSIVQKTLLRLKGIK